MEITTTDKTIRIKNGKEISTHPVNSISYAVNDDMDSVTFFRNNEAIGTSPLGEITVDEEMLTKENADNILNKLFL